MPTLHISEQIPVAHHPKVWRTLSIQRPLVSLPFRSNRSDEAVNQLFSTGFRPRDCGRAQFGILMAVGGFDIFGRHLRIRVRKLYTVMAEAARQ